MTSKRKPLLLAAVLLCLPFTACNKKCVCESYSGAVHEYTEEEVDAQGGSCNNMKIQANTLYYSHCAWE